MLAAQVIRNIHLRQHSSEEPRLHRHQVLPNLFICIVNNCLLSCPRCMMVLQVKSKPAVKRTGWNFISHSKARCIASLTLYSCSVRIYLMVSIYLSLIFPWLCKLIIFYSIACWKLVVFQSLKMIKIVFAVSVHNIIAFLHLFPKSSIHSLYNLVTPMALSSISSHTLLAVSARTMPGAKSGTSNSVGRKKNIRDCRKCMRPFYMKWHPTHAIKAESFLCV